MISETLVYRLKNTSALIFKGQLRAVQQHVGDGSGRRITPFETDASKMRSVPLSSLSRTIGSLAPVGGLYAYTPAYIERVPTAATDKLKGVLSVADLNRFRSDAGGRDTLDTNDMTRINTIVEKDIPAQLDSKGVEFARNLYRVYLAQFERKTTLG